MDQEALVNAGRSLVIGLEGKGVPVRGAMWVHSKETDGWRLWMVGKKGVDKREFYAAVASQIHTAEKEYPGFSISDVELKAESDPVIQALARFCRVEGLGVISMSRNMVNGVYTPDGIMLRMTL
ncbi:MAG: hypothetical protein ACTJG9_08760 [Alcaligenes aquatilis]